MTIVLRNMLASFRSVRAGLGLHIRRFCTSDIALRAKPNADHQNILEPEGSEVGWLHGAPEIFESNRDIYREVFRRVARVYRDRLRCPCVIRVQLLGKDMAFQHSDP